MNKIDAYDFQEDLDCLTVRELNEKYADLGLEFKPMNYIQVYKDGTYIGDSYNNTASEILREIK